MTKLDNNARLYDRYLKMNKSNYKNVLSSALKSNNSLVKGAKKETDIKSAKTATFSQAKRFFAIVFILPF